ncbi:s-adenosylmethionine carrier protein [Anaeramoeba ignava]|uniref:S-adenosylmethionine carrier protein n=1 Tax=Anaeramoeba ignava TaxID=1746090 RepID=A0A9Q0LBR3_ANAIG|nr:s-adenosylmethionine carrier protein [Anaeramoeba ignava]
MNQNQSKKKEEKHFKPIRHLLIGALARSISTLCTSSIDTIKTRTQFYGKMTTKNNLQKALFPSLLSNVPTSAISFLIYHYVKVNFAQQTQKTTKTTINQDKKISSKWENFWMKNKPLFFAALTRTLIISIRNPIEIAKQRMQLEGTNTNIKSMGFLDILNQLYKESGFSGLFNGYSAYLTRDFLSYPFYWGTYDYIKGIQLKIMNHPQINNGNSEHKLGVLNYIVSATAATFVSAIITMPFDVVKTKIQTRDLVENGAKRFPNMFRTFQTVYLESGLNGFFHGLFSRISTILPSTIISFVVYEYLIEKLNQKDKLDQLNCKKEKEIQQKKKLKDSPIHFLSKTPNLISQFTEFSKQKHFILFSHFKDFDSENFQNLNQKSKFNSIFNSNIKNNQSIQNNQVYSLLKNFSSKSCSFQNNHYQFVLQNSSYKLNVNKFFRIDSQYDLNRGFVSRSNFDNVIF